VRISEGRRLIVNKWRQSRYRAPHQLTNALADISKAHELDPERFHEEEVRAFVAEYVGQYDLARKLLRKVEADRELNPRARLTRARLLSENGQYAAALDMVLPVLDDSEVGGRAKAWAIVMLTHLGRRNEARLIADEWVKLAPMDPDALSFRGSLRRDNEIAERFEDLGAAIAADPETALPWCMRALRHVNLRNDVDSALADLDQCIQLQPRSFVPYYFRASLLIDRDSFASARRDLDRAAELNPYLNWTYRRRAVVLEELHETEAAAADRHRDRWLERLYDLAYQAGKADTNPFLWAEVARHSRRGDDWIWAEIAIKEALRCQSDSGDGLRERAALKLHRGDFDGALADAQAAVDQSETGLTLEVRGGVYAARGEWDLAIADYEAGNVVTEAVAHAYDSRAKIRQRAGRTSLAQADRDAAARLRRLLDEP
jgi:tetratricopeptide (TPR) repeat protein